MTEFDSLWQGVNIALAVKDKTIAWVGETLSDKMKAGVGEANCHAYVDSYLSPGLIDAHTHLIYAGERAKEFEMRLQGMRYADIAKQGGGIRSTVKATRAASAELLYKQAKARLLSMIRQGVTTVEIKSGYGLDLDTEIKMLKVARQLGRELPIHIVTSYLGAHTLPPEYKDRPDAYIDFICESVLPQLHEEKLVDHVDVFCETIGFTLAQTQKIFEKALSLGLKIKCHAEQLSLLGASECAANHGALSCDHLEYIDEAGVAAMAKQGTVAVLLPGAYYFLKDTKKPPVELFREYQVKMAVATDANPGSSPTTSLPLMMNMACVLFGLSIEEAWLGVTEHAATALGIKNSGVIAVGQQADFCLWPFQDKSSLCYTFGGEIKPIRVYQGKTTT